MAKRISGSHRARSLILRSLIVAMLATVGALGLGAAPAAATFAEDPVTEGDLHVMTFNLRYAGPKAPTWPVRRPVTRALLTTERPDLIGTQEGLAGQLRDIETDLGAGYDFIGVGREGGNRGEHMAIFYRKQRLAPQAAGHFWLSDTPEVAGSNTWGARSIRMVTWVRFLDRTTGKRFYAVNTHLDSGVEYARRRAAELIRQRLAALRPALPIILTGDFNTGARPGSYVHDLLVGPAGLRDTWTTAGVNMPAYGTFHDYGPLVPDGRRIDWVLTTPDVTALAARMNIFQLDGQYPSDHLPVQVWLRLP
jgi:endonuclease/exonuclease/phosphatase family metal-dependent hydrolase